MEFKEIADQVSEELLKTYQPVIVVYYPTMMEHNNMKTEFEILKARTIKQLNMYQVIFLPNFEEDEYRVEMLSVFKSKITIDNTILRRVK